MAWLLTEQEFRRARDDVRSGEVTPELYEFVWRLVVATTAGGLLAPALSPTGAWDDDARTEVVQGFFEGRMVRGGLQRAFDRCTDPKGLARYLEVALLNWLRSEARTKQRPRFIQRTRKLLGEDDAFRSFVDAASWVDAWWGLTEWWEPEPFQGTDDDLIGATSSLGPFRLIRFSRSGARADPVLSTHELRRLIFGVFERGERLLTVRHFDRVFRGLFPHAYAEEVPLDATADVTTPELAALDDIVAQETAQEILLQLTDRQLSLLADRIAREETLEQLATRYHVSRGTVDNELRRTMTIVGEAVGDDADIELVLEKLIAMAF